MTIVPPVGASTSGSNLEEARPCLLIVDDQPPNIYILSETLGDKYKFSIAANGIMALEISRRPRKPDLILLDVMMPEMDGYEVCRQLKEDPATRDIPIIFVTALDQNADESRGLELGAADYITKPYKKNLVRLRVRNHLAFKFQRDLLLKQKVELAGALAKVKLLSGMLPICASCKKIRDDQGYWQQLEGYISRHSEAEFTHGICPDCMCKLYPDLVEDGLVVENDYLKAADEQGLVAE